MAPARRHQTNPVSLKRLAQHDSVESLTRLDARDLRESERKIDGSYELRVAPGGEPWACEDQRYVGVVIVRRAMGCHEPAEDAERGQGDHHLDVALSRELMCPAARDRVVDSVAPKQILKSIYSADAENCSRLQRKIGKDAIKTSDAIFQDDAIRQHGLLIQDDKVRVNVRSCDQRSQPRRER